MKKTSFIIFLGLFVGEAGVQAQSVVPSQKRMESLDLARKLLTTEPVRVDAVSLTAKNPFVRRQVAVVQDAPAVIPSPAVDVNDREVLVYAMGVVTPSGVIKVGDTQLLLFGQKRLKVGDQLPIVFQGKTYGIELTGIERTSFTLRLNKEEITRPIKPVK